MNKTWWRFILMVGTALGAFTTAATSFAAAPALPDSKTGGANGGPLAILFLGPVPWMDKGYAQEFATATVPLRPDFSIMAILDGRAYRRKTRKHRPGDTPKQKR